MFNGSLPDTGIVKQSRISLFGVERTLYVQFHLFHNLNIGTIFIHIQDSVSVENVLYSDERIAEAAAVGVPDHRLGELVAAVVTVKPAFRGRVTEESLISLAQQRHVFELSLKFDFDHLGSYS